VDRVGFGSLSQGVDFPYIIDYEHSRSLATSKQQAMRKSGTLG